MRQLCRTQASRAVGPPLGTAIFAWSVSETRPFPFDYSLAWLLLALMTLGILAYSLRLPPWIERKRIPGDVLERESAGTDARAKPRARPSDAALPVPTSDIAAASDEEGSESEGEGDERKASSPAK